MYGVKMNLIEYSNGIKELLKGRPGPSALQLVNDLTMGENRKLFGFVISDKTIQIIAPTKDVVQSLFDMLNKTMPQDYYDYTIRVTEESKTKTISKRGHPAISIKTLKEDMLKGGNFIRIFYEILTTPDFEITNSEFEGTLIKCNDSALLRRVFNLMVGLFPFVETERETKKVGIECIFDIQKYDMRKEMKKKGTLICNITLDGRPSGSKSSTFIF